MSQEVRVPGGFQEASPAAFASGTRAAGAVIALGYLLGTVPGPVVSVVGGLALITYGRSLLLARIPAALGGAAVAIVAGALGVGALRWEALGLAELRGVQAVLGPTVLVGPTQVAVAAGLATGAALVALAVWLSAPWPRSRVGLVWSALEAVVGALAIVTVFFNPAESGLGGGAASVSAQLLRWAAVTLVAAGAAGAGAWFLSTKKDLWRLVLVAVAGAAVLAAAALLLAAL